MVHLKNNQKEVWLGRFKELFLRVHRPALCYAEDATNYNFVLGDEILTIGPARKDSIEMTRGRRWERGWLGNSLT